VCVVVIDEARICLQFSATCVHVAAAAAAALSCSKGMSADFVARLSCHLCDMEILRAVFIFLLPSRELR